jgi:starch phosphorylase
VIFGLTAAEVAQKRGQGHQPRQIIEASHELSQALAAIASGVFSPDDPRRYSELIGGLYDHDWFMVAADFDSYCSAQRAIDQRWNDKAGWNAAAIRNVANVGWFSSDRTIREYAKEIWGML